MAAHDILVNFEISLVVFITNTPRNRANFPIHICCGLNLSQAGLKFFELVSILFAIVPDYGNEYTTKENKS